MPSHLTGTTSRPDRDDPRLTKVTLSPSSVDLTGGHRVLTVTVDARDASGIGDTFFRLHPLRRVAGDRFRGIWQGTAELDHCVERTREAQLSVMLADRAGNRIAAHPPIAIVNRAAFTPPYPSLVGPHERGSTDPVTYRFGEDVVGISTDSAPVRPTEKGMAFGTGDPPPSVPGSPAGRSAATRVDCVAGPVRTATWAPAQPLTPDQSYLPDFNPENLQDILDLAGNPLDIGLHPG